MKFRGLTGDLSERNGLAAECDELIVKSTAAAECVALHSLQETVIRMVHECTYIKTL